MTYLSSLTLEVQGTRFYYVKLRLRISNDIMIKFSTCLTFKRMYVDESVRDTYWQCPLTIRSWRTGRRIYAAHTSLRFDVVTWPLIFVAKWQRQTKLTTSVEANTLQHYEIFKVFQTYERSTLFHCFGVHWFILRASSARGHTYSMFTNLGGFIEVLFSVHIRPREW